jgi:hypothetical protein
MLILLLGLCTVGSFINISDVVCAACIFRIDVNRVVPEDRQYVYTPPKSGQHCRHPEAAKTQGQN